MDYFSLTGIALGLSMDALAVSISTGAVAKESTPSFAIKVAFCFGLFQAAMPMAGWAVGKAGEDLIGAVDHWAALLLLGYLGVQMITESRKKAHCEKYNARRGNIPLKRLLALAVATSIDALVAGIILPTAVGASTAMLMFTSIGFIGIIAFAICFIGVYIGKKFGILCASHAEIFGGAVLIVIGLKIFVEHMFFS